MKFCYFNELRMVLNKNLRPKHELKEHKRKLKKNLNVNRVND